MVVYTQRKGRVFPSLINSTRRYKRMIFDSWRNNMNDINLALVVIGMILAIPMVLAFITLVCVCILAIAPFFKSLLLNDPDNPNKLALFTAPEPGRSSIIMRGNRIEHPVHGKEYGEGLTEAEQFKNKYLRAYDAYVFKFFGIRLIGVPGIHSVPSKILPRYKKVEVGVRYEYLPVQPTDKGYRTDHLRTQVSTWLSVFPSIDIEGIPFTVVCGTNVRCDKSKIPTLWFGTEAWNVLLDQALYSVARGTILEEATLDDAVGGVSRDVWKEHIGNETLPERGSRSIIQKIFDALMAYKLKRGDTLAVLGIEIESFEIIDYIPELTKEELVQFHAPAIARRLAQARELEGKGDRKYHEEVLAGLATQKDIATAQVNAEAFVKATKGGQIDSLLTALTKKILG